MEQVARWNESSLLPERGFTISPAVDANLRDRIRSLLVARNQGRSPQTPFPSPNHKFTSRGSDENRSDQSLGHTKAHKLNPDRTAVKIARLEGLYSDMGATRFDGPAGRIDDDSSDVNARRPSQPSYRTGREASSEWLWSTPASGLNQRAHVDILGRETGIPASVYRTESSSSKSLTGTRIPRFHLRTVPPTTDANKMLRPKPLHVPGSYQSEIDTRKDHDPKNVSPAIDDTVEARDNGVFAIPYHGGLNDAHSHQTAVDALKDVVKHDHFEIIQPTAEVDQPASSLRNTSPPKMVESNIASIPKNELLAKPITDQATSDQDSQPALEPYLDHGHGQVDDLKVPLGATGDDNDENTQSQDVYVTQIEPTLDTHEDTQDILLGASGIRDLLAKLPPLRQTTVDDIVNHHMTAAIPADSEPMVSIGRSSLVSSLHSLPLNDEELATSPVSPLIPKPLEIASLTREDGDEAIAPLVGDARRSSEATAKLSTISRAISMLSNLSAHSRRLTPALRSSIEQVSTGPPSNLTARPNYRSKRKAQIPERSQGNAMSARQGYKPLRDENQQGPLNASTSTDGTLIVRQQDKQGEGFTKVITDLESLLKEALNIAGQATSRNQSESAPLSSQAQRNGYCRADSDMSSNSSEYPSALSGGIDEENNPTTVPPHITNHKRDHVVINEPESDALYHGHFKKARDATPYPAQTRHQSTVPNGEDDELVTPRQCLEAPRSSSKAFNPAQETLRHQSSSPIDWAAITIPPRPSRLRLDVRPPPPAPQAPPMVQAPAKEQHAFLVREHGISEDTMTRDQVRGYVSMHQRPPIQPRQSSIRLRRNVNHGTMSRSEKLNLSQGKDTDEEESDCECVPYVADFQTSGLRYHPVFQEAVADGPSQAPRQGPFPFHPREDTFAPLRNNESKIDATNKEGAPPMNNTYNLEGRHHFSIREPRGFSLSRSHRRSPIARDWSNPRKRYTATVVCITTAFMGLIVGIYAGEVPAIQYAIADEHHYTILGNVFFFIGLAITTALFYPLPLLHGRKPYTLAALAILLPLQFPQALAISMNRSPYVATYRVGLLVPRMFAGIVMGFANINFKTTLLDLYGASLQSGNPHQETVNANDVRRHGGGMGVWLSIWTWCSIGSIGIGFLIGAGIISGLDVSWGFWILIIMNAAVLVLNILTPEVRRSAYRRSMAEVRSGGDVSRRVARGEIKMHLQSTGPIWWWEEVWWGHVLAIRMLKQPGFAILSLYLGWIYGQVVLVIVVGQPFIVNIPSG
jgi:MFS family permease